MNTRFITIRLWDNGNQIDGDQVDVYVNSEFVRENVVLAAPPGITVAVALKSGANSVKIHADDEGQYSPNTASVEISDVISGPSQQGWGLDTDEDAIFTIVAP
ncbi:MAG: hypothetical protein ACYS0K_05365 [Planctomycetota bacterium]